MTPRLWSRAARVHAGAPFEASCPDRLSFGVGPHGPSLEQAYKRLVRGARALSACQALPTDAGYCPSSTITSSRSYALNAHSNDA